MAEIGLGAFSASSEGVTIIGSIIKTAREAKALKRECEEIASTVTLLQQIIERNPAVAGSSLTEPRLLEVLRNILSCVNKCKQSWSSRALEVLWRRRLPVLMKNLLTWMVYLNGETAVISRDEILKLLDLKRQETVRDDAHSSDVMAKLDILENHIKNQREESAGELGVDFQESDPRLVFSSVSNFELVGTLKVSDSNSVPVVCDPVKEDLMTYGDKGPRHVAIYSQLSGRTHVHPFYGIAQHGGKRWTVFRDFRSCPTLGEAITQGNLPQDISKRIEIAVKIASTLAYLHSVEILLKRLSDKTVLLATENGQLIPYLTEIENARLFKEGTGGGRYDIRYEAPEVSQMNRHTMRTDIWSLGVIIWQCISQASPFQAAEPVTEGPEVQRIANLLETDQYPWEGNSSRSTPNPLAVEVERLARICCSKDPRMRPPAEQVAQSLLNINESVVTHLEPLLVLDNDTHERILGRINAAEQAEPSPSSDALGLEDEMLLRRLVEAGDATAAYLLGRAIWDKLVEPTDEEAGHTQILLVARKDPMVERRCRASIRHLEFALQGGEHEAAELLASAYKGLGGLCSAQAKQHKRFRGRTN